MSAASPRGRARASLALSVVAIAGLALAACTTGGSSSPGASAGPSAELEGTSWQLVEYEGPDGGAVPVPQGAAATALFEDGVVSGDSGCNTYRGTYTLDGDKLTIGQTATTMMACGPVQTALETAYLKALQATATYAISGQDLELKTEGGKVGLKFEVAEAPELTGTRWVATAVNNGRGGFSSVVEGSTVTAIFSEDGKIAGSGGCNEYNGPYTVDGESLKIGPVGATKMLCNEPAGVDDQEAAYFVALGNVATFAFDGDRLQLRDASGALQVEYQPTLPR